MRSFRTYREEHRHNGVTDLRDMSLDDIRELADFFAFSSDKVLDGDTLPGEGVRLVLRSGVYLVSSEQSTVIQRALGHTKWLYEDIWAQMDLTVAGVIIALHAN